MKLLFMGTPDFAVPSLRRLSAEGHDICGVFTRSDKPGGRGMRLRVSPVKACAVELGLDIFQPESLSTQEAYDTIAGLSPEVIVVVAYGKLLPERILNIPPKGCINIHGSLLPAYRGAAPVQWAVLNGEKVTGVTSMYMAPTLDSGDVIDCIQTSIRPEETAEELYSRLSELGAQLLARTLSAVGEGSAKATKQDEALATWAPPLTREMANVDFRESALKISNQIRALRPWPVARAVINGKTYKLYGAQICAGAAAEPGQVLCTGDEGITIACGEGNLLITELQAEGGKRMGASSYLRGHTI